MTTRREFLQVALAASLLPLAATEGGATPEGNAVPRVLSEALHTVLCDERFARSVAWAGDVASRGVSITRFRGDITDFWYTDLSRIWKERAVAIAGVTAYGPLFCLERWGWDYGLKVVRRQNLADAHTGEPLIAWVIAPHRRNQRL